MFTATPELCKSQDPCCKVALVDQAPHIGARIRALREQAGIQSQQLAEKLALDPSAMSNIERGRRAVKTEELAAIAEALGVSPLAILSDDSLLARLPIAPRAEAPVKADGAAIARLTALAELHQLLSEEGIPAEPKLEGIPRVDTVRWLSSASELAEWATEHLALAAEPADRFSALAEGIEKQLGVDVLVEDHSHEGIFGASITDRSFPFILVNRDQQLTRALFTLAHELGHVLSGWGDILTLDTDLSARNNNERVANAFAASLLMPAGRVDTLLKEHGGVSVPALAAMVSEFGVSFESLVYRLHNLGYINAHGRDQLRLRGWTGVLRDLDNDQKRRALLDSLGREPERRAPGLLTLRAWRGYQEGILSVRPLASLLGIDADTLLARLVREQDSLDVLNESYTPEAEAEDEERYSGSPV